MPVEEEKKIDVDCAVCYTIMVEPVTLPCKHTFCRECLRSFFIHKMECPLCRAIPPANFELKVNKNQQKKFKEMDPKAYKSMEGNLRKQNKLVGDLFDLKITFGNRHKLIPNGKELKGGEVNKHEWTMFVKFVDKKINPNNLIEKVRFGLHPTFGMDYQDIKANPDQKFEMKFLGWGTFTIPVTIFFKRECQLPAENRQLKVDHYLSFDGNGKWKTITIQIKKDAAKKLGLMSAS